MTTTDDARDLSPLALQAYRHGTDPLTYAIHTTAAHLTAAAEVRDARTDDPDAYREVVGEVDDEATACRIVGALLDAGWMPPLIDHTERTD